MDKFELVRFTDNGFELDVRADLQHDTVWLSLNDLCVLFDKDKKIVQYLLKWIKVLHCVLFVMFYATTCKALFLMLSIVSRIAFLVLESNIFIKL